MCKDMYVCQQALSEWCMYELIFILNLCIYMNMYTQIRTAKKVEELTLIVLYLYMHSYTYACLCLYAWIYDVFQHIFVSYHVYIHAHKSSCMYTLARMYEYMPGCMYMYVYLWTSQYLLRRWLWTLWRTYLYVYIYPCSYLCVHIYTCIHLHSTS